MDLALALRHIWRQKRWLLLVVLLAIFTAVLSAYDVSVSPPGLKSGSLESGAARQGLVLDSKESSLDPTRVSVVALAQRAVLYAELLRSEPLRKSIGKRADIPWQTISVDGQTGDQGTTLSSQPGEVQRSSELVDEGSSTRLFFTVNPDYPIINLYAQAPAATTAIRLVQGAADSLVAYTSALQTQLEVPDENRAKLIQLGEPQGGVVAPGANVSIALIMALAVLLGGCFLILFIPRVVTAVRQADDGESDWLSDDLRIALQKQYLEAQQQVVDQPNPHEAESHRSSHQVEPSSESGSPL